jgi:hypothetical protein
MRLWHVCLAVRVLLTAILILGGMQNHIKDVL